MAWFFCFYITDKVGSCKPDPEKWFNVPLIKSTCPDVIFHLAETHPIHVLGKKLRIYGMQSSLILEVQSDDEAVILSLLGDELLRTQETMLPKILQLVLNNPDFEYLDSISQPMSEIKKEQAHLRNAEQLTAAIQRSTDRLIASINEFDVKASALFQHNLEIFVESCNTEISAIRTESRRIAKESSNQRKILLTALLSYATFVASPNLK